MLFHAATGRLPFEAETERKYDQLERRADPIRAHRRVPAAFATTVNRCLDPEPSQGPAVGELSEFLNSLCHERLWP